MGRVSKRERDKIPTMSDIMGEGLKQRAFEKLVTHDPVNKPHHYNRGKVECIDAVDACTTDMPGTYAHYTATILTYIWRWYFKNGVEDLKKARWYLNRLIAKLEE